MPLPLTIALTVSRSHTRSGDAQTNAIVFEEEALAHCRSETREQDVKKTARAKGVQSPYEGPGCVSLTALCCASVKGSLVVTSRDNIETSWTRARSTLALMHAHNADNLAHNRG